MPDVTLEAGFTGGDALYPPYVNVRSIDDDVHITVRAPATPDGRCGDTAAMRMTGYQWATFLQQLVETWRPPG